MKEPIQKNGLCVLQRAETVRANHSLDSGSIVLPSRQHAQQHTPEDLARARRTVEQFNSWKQANPDAFGHAERTALKEAARNRRVGGGALLEAIRSKDFTDVEGKPSHVNSNFGPVMVRAIAKEHPEVAPYIEKRTSVYDELGL